MANGILSTIGLGSSSKSVGSKSFLINAKRGKLGKSANSQRHVRKIDFLGNKKTRRNLNQITTTSNVKIISKDGSVVGRKIKKNELADMVKKSDMIGRTESNIQARLKKNRGFTTKDDKGNVIKVDFSGKDNLIKARKLIGEAIVDKRVSSAGLTDEQKKTNVRLGNVTRDMYRSAGGKKQHERIKESVKKKFGTDSSGLGVKQAEYKVGIAGSMKSEGDLRGAQADDYPEKSSGFADMGDGPAIDVAGSHGSKNDDTMKMFQKFGQADSYSMKKIA